MRRGTVCDLLEEKLTHLPLPSPLLQAQPYRVRLQSLQGLGPGKRKTRQCHSQGGWPGANHSVLCGGGSWEGMGDRGSLLSERYDGIHMLYCSIWLKCGTFAGGQAQSKESMKKQLE